MVFQRRDALARRAFWRCGGLLGAKRVAADFAGLNGINIGKDRVYFPSYG